MLYYDYTKTRQLPHFRPEISVAISPCWCAMQRLLYPQELKRCSRLIVHVGCMLLYGWDKWMMFAHFQQWPKGGDLVCTLVYHALRAIKTSSAPASAAPTLFKQFDGGELLS